MISRSLRQKLLAYGLGAGAASIAGNAHATIVYSGTVDFTGNAIFFDLQNMVRHRQLPTTVQMMTSLSSKARVCVGTKAKIVNKMQTPAARSSTRRTHIIMSCALALAQLLAAAEISRAALFRRLLCSRRWQPLVNRRQGICRSKARWAPALSMAGPTLRRTTSMAPAQAHLHFIVMPSKIPAHRSLPAQSPNRDLLLF